VVVGVSARDGGSAYQPVVLDAVTRLSQRLAELPVVKRHTITSVSFGKAKAVSGTADALVVEPMFSGPANDASIAALRQRLANNPVYQGVLISRDETVASVSFGIDVGTRGFRPAIEPVAAVVEALRQEPAAAGLDIRMSGAPVFFATVEQLSQRMAWLFPLALLLIGLIHLEAFRTWQGLLLPLVTAVLAVIWGLGVMGAARVPMDAFNATTPILILAIAAGHAVQILKRYYEEFDRLSIEQPHTNAREINRLAVRQSLLKVAPVMLVAGGVAALGLFSLLLFDVATIRTFGLFTGLGIVCALIIELTFIPALRSLLTPPRRQAPVQAQAQAAQPSHWDRLSAALARTVIARRGLIVAGFITVAAVCTSGWFFLNQENSTKSYFDHDLPVRQDDRFLNSKLAGTNTLYVVLQGERDQIKEPAVLRLIEQTQRHIEGLPEVGKTLSIVDFVGQMNRSMNGNAAAADVLPPSKEAVSQYLLLYSLSGDPTDFDAHIDYDAKSACITIWMKNDSSKYSAQIVSDIRNYLQPKLPAGMSLRIGGSVPQTSALSETLVRGKLMNIAQMLGVILLAGALIFRSLLAGVYLALPLAVTVMVNFGVMGITGIPLNTPTSVSSAMAIGIGADYAIYMLYRIREELARTGSLDEAIAHSLRTAGKAVVYVATAVAGGYSVLMLSLGFYIHIWFGVLIVISMVVSAVSALVLVPALVKTFPPAFLRPGRRPNVALATGSAALCLAVSVVAVAAVTLSQSALAQSASTAKPPAPKKPAPKRTAAPVAATAPLADSAASAPVSAAAAIPTPAAAPAPSAPTLSANEWMERNYQVTRVASSLSSAKFVLTSPGGQERVLEVFGATRLMPDGVNNRRVLRFLSPSDVRNTTTLIVEQAGREDDIWIYLPALKKSRRIASDNKKASFVGTDLSYADMAGHRPGDWTHTVLRQDNLGGAKTQVIESLPKTAAVASDSGYSKRVSWIAEPHGLAVKAEFYDPAGKLLKTVDSSDIQQVDAARNKWQAMNVRVKNHQTGHQTAVIVGKYDTQSQVGEEYFNTRYIEREE
jgi:uncharacterized protein